MLTIRQHPHHLDLSILTQTDRAYRINRLRNPSRERKLRVRVDHRLIQSNNDVLVLVVVFVYENYTWNHDAVIRTTAVRVSDLPTVTMTVTETDVGSEKEGGEEDKKAEGDGDCVAETEVRYVVMRGAGEWRRWRWWEGDGGGH